MNQASVYVFPCVCVRNTTELYFVIVFLSKITVSILGDDVTEVEAASSSLGDGILRPSAYASSNLDDIAEPDIAEPDQETEPPVVSLHFIF